MQIDRSTMAGWVDYGERMLDLLVAALGRYTLDAAKLTSTTARSGAGAKRGQDASARLWMYVRDDRPAGATEPPSAWYQQTVRILDWRDGSLREGKVLTMTDTQVVRRTCVSAANGANGRCAIPPSSRRQPTPAQRSKRSGTARAECAEAHARLFCEACSLSANALLLDQALPFFAVCEDERGELSCG